MRPGPCLRLADPASASNLTFGIPGLAAAVASGGIDNAEPEIPGQASPTPRSHLDNNFREGFAALAPLGLAFDGWMFQTQLDDVVDLARALPQTTIVLNHVGGPLAIELGGDAISGSAPRPSGTGGLQTLCWRETDSNPRSPVKKNPFVETVLSTFPALPVPKGTEEGLCQT
jgi:hypothetical protein